MHLKTDFKVSDDINKEQFIPDGVAADRIEAVLSGQLRWHLEIGHQLSAIVRRTIPVAILLKQALTEGQDHISRPLLHRKVTAGAVLPLLLCHEDGRKMSFCGDFVFLYWGRTVRTARQKD